MDEFGDLRIARTDRPSSIFSVHGTDNGDGIDIIISVGFGDQLLGRYAVRLLS